MYKFKLLPGLFYKVKLHPNLTYQTGFFKTVVKKMKLFSLLEKNLHSQNYQKKMHYWVIKNLKRPMRILMLQFCIEET